MDVTTPRKVGKSSLQVMPLGFGSGSHGPMTIFDWVPGAVSLSASARALHEYLGRVWYRIRY